VIVVTLPTIQAQHPLPSVPEAIRQGGLLLQAAWVTQAQSGQWFSANTGTYVRGLQTTDSYQYPAHGNPLAALVVNTAPHARLIEEGHGGFHLPSRIPWATTRKARRTKRGRWYLIIPFRHGAHRTGTGITGQAQRTMLPRPVYARARRLQPGQHLTAHVSAGRGVHMPGLTPYRPAYAPNIRPHYTHASIHEGLSKRGARGHTQYLTFRTMRQDSPGWHIPPQAPRPIAHWVVRQQTPVVAQLLVDAATRDVQAALLRQLGRTP